MKGYLISAEEYAFLCFASGTTKIYGVKQLSPNVEPEQIAKTLTKKQYIKRDFDGNMVIAKELAELIAVCVNCERLFILNLSVTYYCKENIVVKLYATEDEYGLCQIDKEQMWEEMKDSLPKFEKEQISDTTDIVLTKKEVEEFKLTLGQTDIYSLVTMDFDVQDTGVDNLIVLSSEKGIYCLEPQVQNLENVVHVVTQTKEDIYRRIDRMKAEG